MAKRDYRLSAVILLLLVCGVAAADDDEQQPDAEFLEYLAMWENEDDSWIVVSVDTELESEDVNDPGPRDEDATEKEDES